MTASAPAGRNGLCARRSGSFVEESSERGVAPADPNVPLFQPGKTSKPSAPQRYSSGMNASNAPLSSGDVNAEPTRGVMPWRLGAVGVLLIGAISAITYGGPVTGSALMVWIASAVLLVVIVGVAVARRRHSSQRGRRPSILWFVVLVGTIVTWNVLAKMIEAVTRPGTVVSYAAQFFSAAAIFAAGMTVLFRLASDTAQPRV